MSIAIVRQNTGREDRYRLHAFDACAVSCRAGAGSAECLLRWDPSLSARKNPG